MYISTYLSSNWVSILIFIIFILIFIFLLLFIFWTFISFYVLRCFKRNIDDNLYHDQFNQSSLNVLEQYGNMPIKNIYLVKKEVQYPMLLLLDVITLFQHHTYIRTHNLERSSSYPYHMYIIVEIELPNKKRKFIMIEKNSCVHISTCVYLHDKQHMIKLKKHRKDITLSIILNDIQNTVGKDAFFNWHIYKNNCQTFTKHILDCLHIKHSTYKAFNNNTHDTPFINDLKLSDFNLHTINCIINTYEFVKTLYMNWF